MTVRRESLLRDAVLDEKRLTEAQKADKHACYQEAVQSPKKELINLVRIAHEMQSMRGCLMRRPRLLREDFCGTAILCQEWTMRHVEHGAIGVDIDPQVLEYAESHFRASSDRIELINANVLDVQGAGRADILVALNYAVCYFHTHEALTRYLRKARESLADGGVFICDLFGGKRSVFEEWRFTRRCSTFQYIFEQSPVGLLDNVCTCTISFKFRADGSSLKRAFTYKFRLWTVPDVLEALRLAGFKAIEVWLGETRWSDSDSDPDPDSDSDSEEKPEPKGFTRITNSAAETTASTRQPTSDCWNVYIAAMS